MKYMNLSSPHLCNVSMDPLREEGGLCVRRPGTVGPPQHYSSAPLVITAPLSTYPPEQQSQWVRVDSLRGVYTPAAQMPLRSYQSTVRWRRRRRRGQTKRASPMFAYLMSSKQRPYIGLASNPFMRLRCHNREANMPSGAKSTRSGAPHWRMRMVIGPMFRGADAFHAQWRDESRKLTCRLAQGCLKALTYRRDGLCVWADDPDAVIQNCLDNMRRHHRRLESALAFHRRIACLSSIPTPARRPSILQVGEGSHHIHLTTSSD
ncbi:MAG: hypothetical protein JKY23_00475 [Nitrospinaceae bacterium]|nr:hypothetical protein [Nitrospinaceae bacterium]